MECAKYKGQIVVRGDWSSDFTNPITIREYWPTGLVAGEYPQLIGKKAYRTNIPWVYRIEGIGIEITLKDREKTRPVYVESKKIKKPKWAVRYRSGKWCRY